MLISPDYFSREVISILETLNDFMFFLLEPLFVGMNTIMGLWSTRILILRILSDNIRGQRALSLCYKITNMCANTHTLQCSHAHLPSSRRRKGMETIYHVLWLIYHLLLFRIARNVLDSLAIFGSGWTTVLILLGKVPWIPWSSSWKKLSPLYFCLFLRLCMNFSPIDWHTSYSPSSSSERHFSS